jgi:hypothetical protein
MWQNSTTDVPVSLAQKSFREALDGLQNSKVTREHWQTLSSRVQRQLTIQEVSSFDGALRIYSKKAAAGEYNHNKLSDLSLASPYYSVYEPA